MRTNIKSRVILGNWYSPERFIREHKSVVLSDYFCTSSSAGDWNGYFVQKFGGKYGLFMFSQENRWPLGGYNLSIDENAIGYYLEKPKKETVEQFIIDYFELFVTIKN
jgi:hypothetical protein